MLQARRQIWHTAYALLASRLQHLTNTFSRPEATEVLQHLHRPERDYDMLWHAV